MVVAAIIIVVTSLGSGCFFLSSLPVKLLGKQWRQWPWGLSALVLAFSSGVCWTPALKLPSLPAVAFTSLSQTVLLVAVKSVQGSWNETGNHKLFSKKVASDYLFIYFFLLSSCQRHNSRGDTKLEVCICTREWCLFPFFFFLFFLVPW